MTHCMKTCNVCNAEKPKTDFYREAKMPDGLRKQCKSCKNESKRKWAEGNKEKWNAYMRKFRLEHPLSIKDKVHKTNRVMRCRYGMDIGTYDKMLDAQGGRCPVCQKHTSELRKPLVVDHCHKSGKVRGLLCFSCNRSIAILDNPELFKRATEYLNLKA